MATVDEVYRRALRLIKVLDVGESPSGPAVDVALPILNQMMARWEEDGIAVGWVAVSSTGTTISAPDSALQAIAYNYAVMLAPEYDVEPSALVLGMAASELAALQRDSIKHSLEPSDMSHLPGQGSTFNINTGD